MRPRIEIWSGGQTGVDRAALDCARELGWPYGGWVPLGRLAEDGVIPEQYQHLRETASAEYDERTRRNVRETDATLVLSWGEASGGTRYTLEVARQLGRPCREVDLARQPAEAAAREVRDWLDSLPDLIRLNVAGPRASQAPAGYRTARDVLLHVLAADQGPAHDTNA